MVSVIELLLLAGVALVVLYAVVRAAVHHGIRDAERAREQAARQGALRRLLTQPDRVSGRLDDGPGA